MDKLCYDKLAEANMEFVLVPTVEAIAELRGNMPTEEEKELAEAKELAE